MMTPEKQALIDESMVELEFWMNSDEDTDEDEDEDE